MIKNRIQKLETARRPDWKTRLALELLRKARQQNGNPQPVPDSLPRSEALKLLIEEMPN